MPQSERQRELRRRRKRKKKVALLRVKASKASSSEKTEIANKLREMTPGAPVLIADMGLES